MSDEWDKVGIPVDGGASDDPWSAVGIEIDQRPTFARSMMGTADSSAVPQQPSAGSALLQGHHDAQSAVRQRAVPVVRDVRGNYIRKPIGEIEEFDFGPAIRKEDGSYLAFNPAGDVMLRDPQSGKLIAFERHPDLDNPSKLETAGREVLEGFMVGPVTRLASSGAIPMAAQRGVSGLGFPRVPEKLRVPGTDIAVRDVAQSVGLPVSQHAPRASVLAQGERMEDAAAFAQLGTEPFAPAFRSLPAARTARTIEEMPLVGSIVKNPKSATETALAQEQARIAASIGGATTDEAAGRVLQGGLDRFRNAGIRDVEPGVLAARGIEPREAVQPTPFMSGGAIQRAEEAQPIREALGGGVAQTSRGVEVPAARPLDQTFIARRSADSLSDAELDTLIRTAANETSFGVRQDALFEKAWRSIPDRFRVDASRNPERLAAVNTRAALTGIDDAISSQIAGQRTITGPLAERIRNPRSHFDMNDLRAMRTEVGRALSSMDPQQTRLNSTQLRQLYGALSRDIEVGLQDIANRAYVATQSGGNRADRVAVEAARRADQALRDFRVADRYTRLGMDRMAKFSRVLGADSPEAAMRGLSTRIREGTIDRGMVRAVTDALRPEERGQVLGYLIANMGKGRPGGQQAEAIWNLNAFATDWNRNKVALGLMFKGLDPNVRQRLDALANVAERMKRYESTRNFSGTAYSGLPFVGAASGFAGGLPGMILSTLGMIGGSAALGKFLTNPNYLDWMVQAATKGGEVPRAVGPQVAGTKWPTIVSNLERIAANDNELGPIIQEGITRFRNYASDPASVEQEAGTERNDAFEPQAQPGRNSSQYPADPHGAQPNPRGRAVPQGMMRLGGPESDGAVDGGVAPNALAGPQSGLTLPRTWRDLLPSDEMMGNMLAAGQGAVSSVANALDPRAIYAREVERIRPRPEETQGEALQRTMGEFAAEAVPTVAMASAPFVGKLIAAAPRAAVAAGFLATATTAGESQSRGAPSDETRALQRRLKDAGYYTGPIDGITGDATLAAQEKFEGAESAKRAEERAKAQLDLEQARTVAEQQKAQAALAETVRKEKQAEDDKQRRLQADERIREIEKNIPWYSQAIREYGPVIGYGVGGALGLFTRRTIVNGYNAIAQRTAERADALMSGGGDWPARAARVNQFWGEGQPTPLIGSRQAPFVAAPGNTPPIRTNPNAPAAADLYQADRMSTMSRDAGVVGAGLLESFASDQLMGERARTDLAAAREAMEKDPSEANIARYQGAQDLVAYVNLVTNAGRGLALGYVGGAAKMKRDTQIRPNVNAAEAERTRIDAYVGRSNPAPDTPGPGGAGPSSPTQRGARPGQAEGSQPSAEPASQRAKKADPTGASEPTPGKSGKTWHDPRGHFTAPPTKKKGAGIYDRLLNLAGFQRNALDDGSVG